MPAFPALQEAIDEVFDTRIGDVSGRGKLGGDMREIWMMQPRFDKRVGSTPYSLVEQARFRAAFDFMRLRADVGEVSEAIAEWWQEFGSADDLRRQDLLDQVREEQKPAARTRVRVRNPAGEGAAPPRPSQSRDDGDRAASGERDERHDGGGFDGDAGPAVPPDGEAAPRKRRRRRKPRSGGEGGSDGSSKPSDAGGGDHGA
jgi:poly(A) polymerase